MLAMDTYEGKYTPYRGSKGVAVHGIRIFPIWLLCSLPQEFPIPGAMEILETNISSPALDTGECLGLCEAYIRIASLGVLENSIGPMALTFIGGWHPPLWIYRNYILYPVHHLSRVKKMLYLWGSLFRDLAGLLAS